MKNIKHNRALGWMATGRTESDEQSSTPQCKEIWFIKSVCGMNVTELFNVQLAEESKLNGVGWKWQKQQKEEEQYTETAAV